jgi:hypothetical protein
MEKDSMTPLVVTYFIKHFHHQGLSTRENGYITQNDMMDRLSCAHVTTPLGEVYCWIYDI